MRVGFETACQETGLDARDRTDLQLHHFLAGLGDAGAGVNADPRTRA